MSDLYVVGAGPGGSPQINVYDAATDTLLSSFFAFSPSFTGGVFVSIANVAGVNDLVVGAGPGGGPDINVYDAATGTLLSSFSAFVPAFTGGVSVGVANVSGQAVIVAGPGAGTEPLVQVFNASGTLATQFLAFNSSYTGGVSVAVADINGQAEIAASGGGQVALFDNTGSLLTSFQPLGSGFTGTASVSIAEINGQAEIAVGANGQVALFNNNGSLLTSIAPFGSGYTGGVSVSLGDVNGTAEIVAGAAAGAAPEVAVLTASGTQLDEFLAFNPAFTGGVSTALDPTSVACFAAGTRIATEHGATAVEDLRVGDSVVTAFGETAEVIWVGHRRVDCRGHDKPRTVWPVRVTAHAFADGVPERDVWLSPDHAIYLDDVLIPVRYLINGTSVVQETVDRIDYYHVELAVHDVLLADGLPAESYLDDGGRAAFNAGGGSGARPALSHALVWEAKACAALTVRGDKVDAVRALLHRRAPTPEDALAVR